MKWNDSDYRPITDKIIKAFYKVHNQLGPGLLERAYHKALFIELSKDLRVDSEKEFPVMYETQEVSRYVPDLLIEERVIVEVKAVKELNDDHKAQLISQLRASKILIGFLVNFAKKELEFKRFDNFYQIEKEGLSLEDRNLFQSL
ncbi:MAG: GxxExxY protein [bacterium (Candidatus Stahlbacteria) CG23_combo_of_CG06-09_8_20_14_all_40_9]|nr:MAG: GxxExxY protein [bacterium (Candidatus Stahlbacteria) CG23_combo_of_CG06-09_8_20_14_all_40_9]